jgi:hypothetical protein
MKFVNTAISMITVSGTPISHNSRPLAMIGSSHFSLREQ